MNVITLASSDRIKGRIAELPTGGSVFVGQRAGEEQFYVQLFNGVDVRRFTLTRQAGEALRELLSADDGYGEPASYDVQRSQDCWVLRGD
ncbi:MAG TPA: hypothetical protein VFO41_09440 [Alphaproteobacteria bacterium]|nr:hypothetical protein [Alphaproteobacteria bacterium]